MKLFLIVFGILTVIIGLLFVLYGMTYEERYTTPFLIKESLGILFISLGGYLIYQTIRPVKRI